MKLYVIAENTYPRGHHHPYGVPVLLRKRVYTIRGARIALGRAKAQYRKLGKSAYSLDLIEESFWPEEWLYSDWAAKQIEKIVEFTTIKKNLRVNVGDKVWFTLPWNQNRKSGVIVKLLHSANKNIQVERTVVKTIRGKKIAYTSSHMLDSDYVTVD